MYIFSYSDPKKIFELCEKAVALSDHGDIKIIFDTVCNTKKRLSDKGSKLNNILVDVCKKFKDMPDNVQTLVSKTSNSYLLLD